MEHSVYVEDLIETEVPIDEPTPGSRVAATWCTRYGRA
jgi:hypothetical protein